LVPFELLGFFVGMKPAWCFQRGCNTDLLTDWVGWQQWLLFSLVYLELLDDQSWWWLCGIGFNCLRCFQGQCRLLMWLNYRRL